jgi:MraZ protein
VPSFLGKYRATLDAKNRVAVPARLRERVDDREKDRFVLAVLPEGCLVLYPISEWDRIAQDFKERAKSSLGIREARALERELFANANEVACDKQGRILIPEELRDRAGLQRDVTFVGVRNRVELWDSPAWVTQSAKGLESFDRIAEELLG